MKVLGSLIILSVIFLGVKSRDYKYHVPLKPGVFDVYWTVNTSDILKTFYFKFVAKTTGWAALAWTTSSSRGKYMESYDIALGGVKNGSAYLNDYWSDAYGRPTLDNTPTQSLKLNDGKEENGFTTIEFSRSADTGDTGTDTPLENGTKTYLAWAIAVADVTNKTNYSKHSERSYSAVAYNMFTGEPMEEPTTKQPSTTSVASTKSVTSNTKLSLLILAFVQLPAMFMFG